MEEERVPEINEAEALAFEEVTESFRPAGGARREEPKFTVTRTGRVKSNTEGKEMLLGFMQEHGHNPNDFEVRLGGHQASSQIAVYAPKPTDKSRVKVTQYDNAAHFHAGAAFRQYPKIRPNTTVDCHVRIGKDAKGEPCLIINVGGGTPTKTVKRKKKGEEESKKN